MPSISKERKAERKLAKKIAEQEFVENLIGDLKDIVKEIIRATNSNPFLGVVVGIVIIDILYRAKIISITAVYALYVALGIAEGGTVISDLSNIIPSLQKEPTPTTPSAQTLVYADSPAAGSTKSKLDTLLSRLGKK